MTKRFFDQGAKIESGPNAGTYFYTRDHLGSIRELTDSSGAVRARYSYDPFGRRTRVTGDIEADFGFTGMFLSAESGQYLATFRVYDPELGRWLSRDPLRDAEKKEGPNLYAYVGNNPVNMVDPLGLNRENCCKKERESLTLFREFCGNEILRANELCSFALRETPEIAPLVCSEEYGKAARNCAKAHKAIPEFARDYYECMKTSGCSLKPPPCPTGIIARRGLQIAIRRYFDDVTGR